MENRKQFIEACWTLVRRLDKMILVVDMMGTIEAYVVDNFKCKGRDFFQNEVIGAQEITDLVQGIEMHSMNDKLSIESKLEGRPKRDFTFGHDNFLWLKMIQKFNTY